ncbi:MAG: helix-turn-helix transcriptional regulator [Bacilli bacterium]|nr:helix-turn-helix transcriptional regulator [Bacilli bacterium]
MNIYKSLNRITEYIDKHLEDKIDYKVLAKMIGTNVYTLQRIFSLLIYDLDNTMYYWEYFNYKDEPYRRIYKIFTEDGWSCEG